jgi:hypothetical protein
MSPQRLTPAEAKALTARVAAQRARMGKRAPNDASPPDKSGPSYPTDIAPLPVDPFKDSPTQAALKAWMAKHPNGQPCAGCGVWHSVKPWVWAGPQPATKYAAPKPRRPVVTSAARRVRRAIYGQRKSARALSTYKARQKELNLKGKAK